MNLTIDLMIKHAFPNEYIAWLKEARDIQDSAAEFPAGWLLEVAGPQGFVWAMTTKTPRGFAENVFERFARDMAVLILLDDLCPATDLVMALFEDMDNALDVNFKGQEAKLIRRKWQKRIGIPDIDDGLRFYFCPSRKRACYMLWSFIGSQVRLDKLAEDLEAMNTLAEHLADMLTPVQNRYTDQNKH